MKVDNFFERYQNLKKRHYYEHITIDTPCRLYFDLEFIKACNEGFDEIHFLDKFIRKVTELLKECFDETVCERDFLVLDSSTDEKYSKHIIVQTSKLFPNNVVIKRFIDMICQNLKNEKIGMVKNKDNGTSFVVDDGVYNKNRNFRLYLSSKYGKTAILDVDKRFYKYFGTSIFQYF